MSEKKISYLNRTFEDYQASLLNYVKTYYPNIADKFDDAAINKTANINFIMPLFIKSSL